MDTEAAAGSDWTGNSKSSDTISFYFLRSPFLLCHSPALSDDQAFTVSDSAILQFAELCLCRKKNCQNWLAIRTIVHSQILLLSILSIYFYSDKYPLQKSDFSLVRSPQGFLGLGPGTAADQPLTDNWELICPHKLKIFGFI